MGKLSDEVIAKARELRAAGASYGEIRKNLGVAPSSLHPYLKDIELPAEAPVTRQKDLTLGAKEIPVSQTSLDIGERIRQMQQERQLIDSELAARAARRRLSLDDLEESIRVKEQELVLNQRLAQLGAALPGQAGQAPESGEQSAAGFQEKIEKLQNELSLQKETFLKETHRLEIAGLGDKIAGLSARLDSQDGVGRTQWDIILEGMRLLSQQFEGIRKDGVALFTANATAARFNPHRPGVNPKLTRQQGEALVARLEGGELVLLECPGCHQEFPVAAETLRSFLTLQCPGCGLEFSNPVKPKIDEGGPAETKGESGREGSL